MDGWVVLLAVREATGDANKVSFSAFSSTLESIRRGKFESLQLCRACFGLPVVGRLFRNSARTNDKDELLIFITPRIIREGVGVR